MFCQDLLHPLIKARVTLLQIREGLQNLPFFFFSLPAGLLIFVDWNPNRYNIHQDLVEALDSFFEVDFG